MFDYIPEVFAADTADTEEEADRWYTDKKTARRPPELLPRDEVARAINTEVKAGRGTAHGGVYLDIASRRDAETIRRRLPSMYHQFKELADVDITREPMEVGPTCHYVMGGIKVDPESQATTLPGLFAAGECAAGLHGSNRLGGNSLSDLVVFGRRAGAGAAAYAAALPADARPVPAEAQVAETTALALAPFARAAAEGGTENPYTLQHDLQAVMQSLVGIIRNERELTSSLGEIAALRERAEKVAVEGHRQYNPGWHLALDLRSMLLVAECVATSALARRESRGGHTREDFPGTDPVFAKVNHVLRLLGGQLELTAEPLPQLPEELAALFDPAAAPPAPPAQATSTQPADAAGEQAASPATDASAGDGATTSTEGDA
jgi:succinate dehydrogenase / fumarate reductase flavoprotein subunit